MWWHDQTQTALPSPFQGGSGSRRLSGSRSSTTIPAVPRQHSGTYSRPWPSPTWIGVTAPGTPPSPCWPSTPGTRRAPSRPLSNGLVTLACSSRLSAGTALTTSGQWRPSGACNSLPPLLILPWRVSRLSRDHQTQQVAERPIGGGAKGQIAYPLGLESKGLLSDLLGGAKGSLRDPPVFELTDPSVTGAVEGASRCPRGGVPTPPRTPPGLRASAQAHKWIERQQPSICGLCKLMEGSGGRESPPAAGGGPVDSSDGRMRYGPAPKYGRDCADVKALRRKVEVRDFTTARRTTTEPGATLPHQLQTATKLRIRRHQTDTDRSSS